MSPLEEKCTILEWRQLAISLSDICWLNEEFTCLASVSRQAIFCGKCSNSNHSKVIVRVIKLFCENCNVCFSEAGWLSCPRMILAWAISSLRQILSLQLLFVTNSRGLVCCLGSSWGSVFHYWLKKEEITVKREKEKKSAKLPVFYFTGASLPSYASEVEEGATNTKTKTG